MNIFTITKNIQKVNKDLDKLKQKETELNEKINKLEDESIHKYEFNEIIETINENLEELNDKVTNILEFKINNNNTNTKTNYNIIKNFLKSIDIEEKYINIYIFLKCKEIKDILILDIDELLNLSVPLNTIKYINAKTNSFVYNYQDEYV